MTSVHDVHAGELLVLDAHRAHARDRFVVRSDELLNAFLELEQATRGV
ncbi:MAG: hypothetical protein H0U23_14760 [Blastocatellia bacterium]|nr:hypothetical protein [Blastocatellia bacterium]